MTVLPGDHISLFSGVGMTDYAADARGFKTIATAEIDPWNRKVLAARMPDAIHFADVREVKPGVGLRPTRPLLITGGFPCQDLSPIGAGKGLEGDRSGLVHEQLRIVTEFQPEYVLFENSSLLPKRGLDVIITALWKQHYHVRWECIPAGIVDAPHLRDRCWIMARKQPFALDRSHVEIGDFSAEAVPAALPRSGFTHYQQIFGTAPLVTRRAARLNAEAIHGTLLPTPRAAPNEWRTTRNAPTHGKGHGKTMAGELNDRWRMAHPGQTPPASSESCGNVDPTYVEWVMGLPFDWTNPDVPNAALRSPMSWRDPKAGLLQTLVADAPHRRGRLKALGNGLVPQVATLALDLLLEGE